MLQIFKAIAFLFRFLKVLSDPDPQEKIEKNEKSEL